MSEEIEINELADLMSALNASLRKSEMRSGWWRGHADKSWKLLPYALRPDESGEDESRRKETSRYNLFIKDAQIRHLHTPDPEDYLSWMFLMQHYGLATRLLDWSSSALIALYFAVCNDNYYDRDGALYSLSPGILNYVESSFRAIHTNNDINDLGIMPKVVRQYSEEFNDGKIYSIAANHFDTRHIIQQAVSTLHCRKTPLEDHPSANDLLVKFVVPASSKEGLFSSLTNLGISRSYLFPDLINLAKDIDRRQYTTK